jgi:hypothetical protein
LSTFKANLRHALVGVLLSKFDAIAHANDTKHPAAAAKQLTSLVLGTGMKHKTPMICRTVETFGLSQTKGCSLIG